MTKEQRINQVKKSITAFGQETYYNKDLIYQYELLEKQLSEVAFNNEHAAIAQIKIKDVIEHFIDMNTKCNHIADKELEEFMSINKELMSHIKRLKSGARGEKLTLKHLEMLKVENKIISNLELFKNDHVTEIDAVVFTQKAIFIIEVKSTGRNVIIDEKGNYIKTGKNSYMKPDFGEKMNQKEYLLSECLKKYGIKNPKIVSLVVFVDSKISVENRYEYVEHCFLASLPNIINSYQGEELYTIKQIDNVVKKILLKEEKKMYKPDFDVVTYMESFINLLTTLEMASGYYALEEEIKLNEDFLDEVEIKERKRKFFSWKFAGLVLSSVVGGILLYNGLRKK